MKAKILDEVQHLPVEQRIELAEAIWDTVADDADAAALPVSAAHRAELDRRLADLEIHPEAGSSWDEVRSRLERRRAGGAKRWRNGDCDDQATDPRRS